VGVPIIAKMYHHFYAISGSIRGKYLSVKSAAGL